MIDFTHIINFIFKEKNNYNKVDDLDKEKFFFIINRKFARMYPNHAQFFNKKNIDKSSALDLWYSFFIKKRTINIPDWYWTPKKSKVRVNKNNLSKDDICDIIKYYDITEKDIDFLIKYYKEILLEELKKIKKFK